MGNLETDTILKGKYQIKSVLGKNALGITYKGADTMSGSSIVVRELFPEGLCSRMQDGTVVAKEESFHRKKEQYIRQMQLLSRHSGLDGIVDVHDVFEERGTAYCVMEYVAGVSLEKYLSNNNKQFPLKRMKELLLPIVQSLSVLHKEGLIHQNISPDNLIFTNQGILKLIGFGCMEGQISSAGTGYVPVELYRRQQECKPAADIYSLCAFRYRCITCVVPQDAYARLNDDQLRKPSQLGVSIDAGDEAVLMMGLNIYEEKRFQTITAFQNAFYRSQISHSGAQQQPALSASQQSIPSAPQQQAPSVPQQSVPPVSQQQAPSVPQQPVPPVPQQPVPPVGTIIQTGGNGAGSQKPPKQKKKGGNGGMIAIAAIGGILIIGLGISAFFLAKDLLPGIGKSAKVMVDTEHDEEENSTEGESESAKTSIDSEYEEMLAAGDFTGALDKILALDTTELNAREKDALSDILSRAVAGQYTEFENRISESQTAGAYEDAFAAVDEELALYDRLAANSMAAQYVNRQQVEDKRTSIKQSHMNYLTGKGLDDVVGQDNEGELEKLIASLQEYVNDGTMSQEEFEKSRNSAYARFVLGKIGRMGNSNAAPAEIITYIDEKLSDTGNNSSVLEYWDYYQAVMGYGAGNPATVHPSSASGFLLPDSNSMNLTTNDISHLSDDEMRLAIYEIFARHGKIFQDQAVNNYFQAFSWYQPSSNYDESALNAYEKYNLNLLIEYQIAKGYR